MVSMATRSPTEDLWDVVGQESHLMDAQLRNQETASMWTKVSPAPC